MTILPSGATPGHHPLSAYRRRSARVCARFVPNLRRTSRRKVPSVTGRAAIHACSLVLAHAPDLVRHGSKPARELAADSDGLLASLTGGAPHLRGRPRATRRTRS